MSEQEWRVKYANAQIELVQAEARAEAAERLLELAIELLDIDSVAAAAHGHGLVFLRQEIRAHLEGK